MGNFSVQAFIYCLGLFSAERQGSMKPLPLFWDLNQICSKIILMNLFYSLLGLFSFKALVENQWPIKPLPLLRQLIQLCSSNILRAFLCLGLYSLFFFFKIQAFIYCFGQTVWVLLPKEVLPLLWDLNQFCCRSILMGLFSVQAFIHYLGFCFRFGPQWKNQGPMRPLLFLKDFIQLCCRCFLVGLFSYGPLSVQACFHSLGLYGK